MIKQTVKLENGKTVELLTPETQEDVKTLRRMEKTKKIRDRSSFGDALAEEGKEIESGA
jgi:hypothetical protein